MIITPNSLWSKQRNTQYFTTGSTNCDLSNKNDENMDNLFLKEKFCGHFSQISSINNSSGLRFLFSYGIV